MKITDYNKQKILQLYIDTICYTIGIDKEADLFAYQRLLQTKSILSNERLEEEILQQYPSLLENQNETY
jgi:hypothetical protein